MEESMQDVVVESSKSESQNNREGRGPEWNFRLERRSVQEWRKQ